MSWIDYVARGYIEQQWFRLIFGAYNGKITWQETRWRLTSILDTSLLSRWSQNKHVKVNAKRVDIRLTNESNEDALRVFYRPVSSYDQSRFVDFASAAWHAPLIEFPKNSKQQINPITSNDVTLIDALSLFQTSKKTREEQPHHSPESFSCAKIVSRTT